MSVNTITKICQIKIFRKTPAKINNPCYIERINHGTDDRCLTRETKYD